MDDRGQVLGPFSAAFPRPSAGRWPEQASGLEELMFIQDAGNAGRVFAQYDTTAAHPSMVMLLFIN